MSHVVYFAGSLFTQAERDWNARIAAGLRAAGLTVILPQERAAALVRAGEPLPVRQLYESALNGIDAAEVILAVLDGSDPDSGTSFECGYAHALGKTLIGLRTDLRLGGDDAASNVNLMLSQASRRFVYVASGNMQDVVDGVMDAINR